MRTCANHSWSIERTLDTSKLINYSQYCEVKRIKCYLHNILSIIKKKKLIQKQEKKTNEADAEMKWKREFQKGILNGLIMSGKQLQIHADVVLVTFGR